MRVETSNIAPIEDIFAGYSGRRLQYAIKLGVLPIPESLCQFLKRKANVKKHYAYSKQRLG